MQSLKIVTFKWRHDKGVALPAIAKIGQYGANHVNKLFHGIERHTTIPHEFICITDNPNGIECRTIPMWKTYRDLGGCYSRLFMFHPLMNKLIGERFVWIDLDTVIVGNIDKILKRKEDFIIHRYYGSLYPKQKYNGSMVMMDSGCRAQVWETFDYSSIEKLDKLKEDGQFIGTDQAWINYVLGGEESTFGVSDGIYEFSKLPDKGFKLPEDARMIMFSGKRDPSMLASKYDWINEHWK